MISNGKILKNSFSNGINKEENILISQRGPSPNLRDPLTPKERWQKRERELKLKSGVLLLFCNLFWIVLTLFPSETPSPKQSVSLSPTKGYEVIKLPALLFAPLPPKGHKLPISIFKKEGLHIIKGFLRKIEEDPLGESGLSAIVEVPQKDLSYIKEQEGPWHIFPPLKEKESSPQRSIYEINF